MSATEAIEAARAAGIHIAIDGDDLVLEASAPPSPVVLDVLSRNKAHVVAMLRRQQPVNEFGPFRPLRSPTGHDDTTMWPRPARAAPGRCRPLVGPPIVDGSGMVSICRNELCAPA